MLIAAGAVLALSACGNQDAFPPPCPSVALLGDAGDLTRYAGAGRDVTDLALAARITAVQGSCARSGASIVRATVTVLADVARGPAMTGRTVNVPYFVAVTENGRILDKHEFVATVDFPPNVTRVAFTGPEITSDLAVTSEKNASVYKIFIGFSLTAEELAYNRKLAGG